jgi:peptide/nickel transport system ATP-binding protein
MALINNPDLLIADEPTTALDVTTQAQILKLMNQLRRDFGSAIILVTHDLGVVAETADDVLVMYAARAAERGTYEDIFYRPEHPYTWGLLNSLPRLAAEGADLKPIPGTPPSLLRPPSGCRFHLRCTYAFEPCIPDVPELLPVADSAPDHQVACHLAHDFREREAHELLHDLMAEQA